MNLRPQMQVDGEIGVCEGCSEKKRIDKFGRYYGAPSYPPVDDITKDPHLVIKKLCADCAEKWAEQIQREREG